MYYVVKKRILYLKYDINYEKKVRLNSDCQQYQQNEQQRKITKTFTDGYQGSGLRQTQNKL